jgi:plasmid stabilization system protein ParE
VAEARLTVSPEADADLAAIGTYIMERDGVARATGAIERIQRTMDNIAFMPGMGRHRPYLDKDMRAFSDSPWLIYYTLKPDDGGIDVLRIVDGRRDLPELFGKNKKKR